MEMEQIFNGYWVGTYRYGEEPPAPPGMVWPENPDRIAFTGTLSITSGKLRGSFKEQNRFSYLPKLPRTLISSISGVVHGSTVNFSKNYPYQVFELSSSVLYTGKLDSSVPKIVGSWVIEDSKFSGSFSMERAQRPLLKKLFRVD